jgi:nicotinamide-nucleotide amidase
MQQMWRETAVPYLKSQGWGKEIIYSRTLRFWGIGESALAEKVTPFFDLTNPTVAPYAGQGEVRLRVSARASSEAEAEQLIEPVAQQLRQIGGLDYFGGRHRYPGVCGGSAVDECFGNPECCGILHGRRSW